MIRPLRISFTLGLLLCAVLSCSSDSPTEESNSIAISVAPSNLQVEQGSEASVSVELVRTDVTGAVDLTVTGLPLEVTATIAPPQLTGSALTATATFAAAETAVPGTATVTIRASGPSVEDATATLTLEVVEAPVGPGPSEGPVWVLPMFNVHTAASPARASIFGLIVVWMIIAFAVFSSELGPALLVGTGVAASAVGVDEAGSSNSPAAQVAPVETSLALFTGGYLQEVVNTATLYDHAAGTQQNLTMKTARTQHTQTRLADGRALIVGGYGPTPPGTGFTTTWRTAEIFDPDTRSFAPTGSMIALRGDHAAALLPDGRVLVTGGSSPVGGLRSAEIYNPATGSFTAAPDMGAVRWLHTATRLPDGRILIAGGQGSGPLGSPHTSAEAYDPSSGQFLAVGPMPRAHGKGHTATLLADGRVLILGGWSGDLFRATAAADVFNPATNSFTAVGAMILPRFEHEAALLADGRVMIVGGQSDEGDNLKFTEIFDPATGIFSPGPEAPGFVFDMASVVLDP